MAFVLALPALIKVALAFALLLTLHRLRVHLSLGMFIGAAALGFMMGLPPGRIASILARSVVEAQTLSLTLIVALILILSRLLSQSGQLDRMVGALARATQSVRLVSAVLPALIGLLPMPGGALFSAPMVKAASKSVGLDPEAKTAINYWFRHIWEYWWPLYPGVVLAVTLLEVETWRFVLIQLPLTLFSVGAGAFFLLRAIPRGASPEGGKPPAESGGWAEFAREVRPILLIVLAIPAVSLFKLATGWALPGLTPVFVGIGLCLVWVIRQNRIPWPTLARAVANRSLPPLLLLILGVMAFKGLLVQSRAVAQIHTEIVHYGIPPLMVILTLPFLSGFITGIALGFVGASFPLIVPLLGPSHGLDFLAHAALAYAFGYMGMMLSPVHLCLLVTRDYFQADLLASYRHLIGPAAVVLLAALSLFLAAQALAG